MVAKTQIERLREPSLKLVDYVTMEMTSIAREVVMKVTRTLSLSWACAQQMVPGPLVVAVLSFFVSLCFYLSMPLFSCLLSMTKQCNNNKTKQFFTQQDFERR